ncbi:MAG: glycosyltransferase [Sphingomicrobium sp.]
MTQRILYISYDGMLEPLGQSQVLAYLEKLAAGRTTHLISFEKPDDWANREQRAAVARRIEDAGICWHPLRYHKRPSAAATAFDIAHGSAVAVGLAWRHRIGVVHARSYIAGLMGLAAKRSSGAKLLFDMRGFWADERVDGNLWPAGGRLYRGAKAAERRLLLAADHVITLTHASVEVLAQLPYLQGRMPPVTVIPTCADLDRFKLQSAPKPDPFVLGYVGSVGTWYLLDEMLTCFRLLREELAGARLLIVNRAEQAMIIDRAIELGIDRSAIEVIAAQHSRMPGLIATMHAAMALYAPSFSRIACAPTKLAEYLGCGVPCLGTAQVGDITTILEPRRIGVSLEEFSEPEMKSAVKRLIALAHEPGVRQRCRQAAVELFSLYGGIASYDKIYSSLSVAPSGKEGIAQ